MCLSAEFESQQLDNPAAESVGITDAEDKDTGPLCQSWRLPPTPEAGTVGAGASADGPLPLRISQIPVARCPAAKQQPHSDRSAS